MAAKWGGESFTLGCCLGPVVCVGGAPDHTWSSVPDWQIQLVLPACCKWLKLRASIRLALVQFPGLLYCPYMLAGQQQFSAQPYYCW